MTQAEAEILILSVNALGTGALVFVHRVLQPVMEAMDAASFRHFLRSLYAKAVGEPLSVALATLPALGAIAYFSSFGFGHRWFVAGFALWLAGSIAAKIINMPIYRWAEGSQPPSESATNAKRRKLALGNQIRAGLALASVVAMACQFSVAASVVTVVVTVLLGMVMTALARRWSVVMARAAS